MTQSELIAAQDAQRTQRSFISLLAAGLGVSDQSYAGEDGSAVNNPGQYQAINPRTGAVGVEGQPISSIQRGVLLSSPLVLVAGAVLVAWLVLRK